MNARTFHRAPMVIGALAALVGLALGALGVMLAVLSRGTSLAIGIGILYALVIEGLLSALVTQLDSLNGLSEFFLRTNSYSVASALGAQLHRAAPHNARAGPRGRLRIFCRFVRR